MNENDKITALKIFMFHLMIFLNVLIILHYKFIILHYIPSCTTDHSFLR
jgi:hypothetical protein